MTEVATTLKKTETITDPELVKLALKYKDNPLALQFIGYAQNTGNLVQRAIKWATAIPSALVYIPNFINHATSYPIPAQPLSGIVLGTAMGLGATYATSRMVGHEVGGRIAGRLINNAVQRINSAMQSKK